MLRLKHPLEPARAIFGELIEPDQVLKDVAPLPENYPYTPGQRIDEVVATYFQKPHSYTANDVVEISAHGAPVVLRHIVELSLAQIGRASCRERVWFSVSSA